MASIMAKLVGWLHVHGIYIYMCLLFSLFSYQGEALIYISKIKMFDRIAVYKAVYPTVGTITDVVAAIDQVRLLRVLYIASLLVPRN